jgi:hypothetical protein
MVWWACTVNNTAHVLTSGVTSGHSYITSLAAHCAALRCAMSSTLMMFAISISSACQHGVVGMHREQHNALNMQ